MNSDEFVKLMLANIKTLPKGKEMVCPFCKSENIILMIGANDSQIYLCLDCHTFV